MSHIAGFPPPLDFLHLGRRVLLVIVILLVIMIGKAMDDYDQDNDYEKRRLKADGKCSLSHANNIGRLEAGGQAFDFLLSACIMFDQ